MGNVLDTPNKAKKIESYATSEGLLVGASCMQGWRLEMEDSHVVMDIPSKPDHTFLAVFDGHGGTEAAITASSNLIGIFEGTEEWQRYVLHGASDISLLGDALIRAFLNMDSYLQERHNIRDISGSTCISAIITPTHIVCANLGDSRAVIGTKGLTRAMSEDHKPNHELERSRIELAGGKVQFKRVDGDLAVSRAFGDFRFKTRIDLGPTEQKISCEPDIAVHERSKNDELLLLACDGLWDVMTNEEAVATVKNIFSTGVCAMTDVAGEILDIALEKGSKDNISAIVVRLSSAQYNHNACFRSIIEGATRS